MLMTTCVSSPRCVPCARSVPSLDLAELIVFNPTLQSRDLKPRAKSLPKVTALPSDGTRTRIQLSSPAPPGLCRVASMLGGQALGGTEAGPQVWGDHGGAREDG